MNDEQRYQQGLQVRTEVLGEKHVGRSLENLNDFNQDFQNFISRFAWGEVWSREGLPRHTRSLVTIASYWHWDEKMNSECIYVLALTMVLPRTNSKN